MDMESPEISASERLLNLVIALVNARTALTREYLRGAIEGYRATASDAAFERQFERDKDTLIKLGVPIVVVGKDGHGKDVGYRIDAAAYSVGDISLTPREAGVVSVATGLWRDRAVRQEAGRGRLKLAAAAESAPTEPDAASLISALSATIAASSRDLDVLFDAVLERQAVTFGYATAHDGDVGRRRVQPWKVALRDGAWYLVGFDLDRAEPRTFNLSRVLTGFTKTGRPGSYSLPAEAVTGAIIANMQQWRPGVARLAVLPGRAGALRAQATDTEPGAFADRDIVTVPFQHAITFATLVAGYGSGVLVLEPDHLRDEVLARLRAAAALACAASGPDGPADRNGGQPASVVSPEEADHRG